MGKVRMSSSPPTSAVGHESIEGTLSVPVLQFDLGEEIDWRMQDSELHGVGRSSKTLAKYDDLRIVLISMKANTVMHEHKAPARISVQTLTGHVQLRIVGRTVDLPAGHLVTLDQSLPHDVIALTNSSILLTLSWPAESASEEPASRQMSLPCGCDFSRWAD
jgi:quercetin dioxygenase-like cupin family protein